MASEMFPYVHIGLDFFSLFCDERSQLWLGDAQIISFPDDVKLTAWWAWKNQFYQIIPTHNLFFLYVKSEEIWGVKSFKLHDYYDVDDWDAGYVL